MTMTEAAAIFVLHLLWHLLVPVLAWRVWRRG